MVKNIKNSERFFVHFGLFLVWKTREYWSFVLRRSGSEWWLWTKSTFLRSSCLSHAFRWRGVAGCVFFPMGKNRDLTWKDGTESWRAQKLKGVFFLLKRNVNMETRSIGYLEGPNIWDMSTWNLKITFLENHQHLPKFHFLFHVSIFVL